MKEESINAVDDEDADVYEKTKSKIEHVGTVIHEKIEKVLKTFKDEREMENLE